MRLVRTVVDSGSARWRRLNTCFQVQVYEVEERNGWDVGKAKGNETAFGEGVGG